MKARTYIMVIVAAVALSTVYFAVETKANRGNGALGVVYVTSQGLWYDTFVSVDSLPPKGRFQVLENGTTEFGPGDPGYLGGRWWVDKDNDGEVEEGETLLCPLLPPGRPMP